MIASLWNPRLQEGVGVSMWLVLRKSGETIKIIFRVHSAIEVSCMSKSTLEYFPMYFSSESL